MSEKTAGFSGCAYVVTGSTQGIGAEIAVSLARAGAEGVIICGRNTEGGARIKAAVEDAGAGCGYVTADLGDADDCRGVIAACEERFGRLDGLVNAAGMTDRGTIDDTSVELWDLMFAVNARAPFILMQDAVALMRKGGNGGAIVNIITMSSHGGQPFITAYSASKGALATLTKNVAHGVRTDRIRVNGINMGWADTPNEHKVKIAEGEPEDWLARAEAEQPFGRLVSTGDVARLTLFLLGPDSGIMTGAVVDCDQNVMGAYD